MDRFSFFIASGFCLVYKDLSNFKLICKVADVLVLSQLLFLQCFDSSGFFFFLSKKCYCVRLHFEAD